MADGPTILDCGDLERAGLWSTDNCCLRCHYTRSCPRGELVLDLGPYPGSPRVVMCHVAAEECHLSGEGMKKLLSPLEVGTPTP